MKILLHNTKKAFTFFVMSMFFVFSYLKFTSPPVQTPDLLYHKVWSCSTSLVARFYNFRFF